MSVFGENELKSVINRNDVFVKINQTNRGVVRNNSEFGLVVLCLFN